MKSKVNPKYQAWLKTLCHLECEGAEVLQNQGRENRTQRIHNREYTTQKSQYE